MEPETLIERLDRERREKRDQQKRDVRVQQAVVRQIETGARPTSRARREETAQRFSELRGHTAPAARPSAPQSVSGQPVEFYCWQGGVIGKITLLVGSPFTPT